MGAQQLARVVDKGIVRRPHATPTPSPTVDLAFLQQAQIAVQQAFAFLQQAQGYTGDGTLGELADAWLGACRRLTRSTQASYRDNARALARELARLRLGDRPPAELAEAGRALRLDAVEAGDMERAIDAIASGRWNSVTCSMRRMVRWGNRHGFPGVAVLLPELRRHKAKPLALPPEAWSRAAHLLHEAWRAADVRSKPTAAAALCAVVWGVRRGAVARLEWSQVDQRRGELRVHDKGRVRIVQIGELAQRVLASLEQRGPYVFAGRDEEGQHVHPNSLTAHTRRVLRAGGVKLTLHQAGRHAAGSAILALGGAPADAAGHLGHVDERVTRERYLPPVEDAARASRARALLQQAWEKGGAA